MAKLRVHELAKELDKTNKEVLDFLQSKGMEVKSHMSSIAEDAEAAVRAAFGKKTKTAPKKKAEESTKETSEDKVAKKATKKTTEKSVEKATEKPVEEAAEKPAEEKPKKKNIIRVFRSQNASGNIPEHRPRRPEGARKPAPKRSESPAPVTETKPQAEKPVAPKVTPEVVAQESVTETAPATPKTEAPAPSTENKTTTPSASATPTQSRPTGTRPAQSQGNRTGGYQGNNQNRTGGYQGNNQNRTGGYQGNNQNRTGGYQGNNQNRTGGYQGNNQNRTGGYQGNSQNRTGGYQGNSQNRTGGYQGNNQNRTGGYQGNSQNRTGGYQGNRPQGQGGRPFTGGRPQTPRPTDVPDAPLVKKPSRDPRKENKYKDKNKQAGEASKRPNQGNRPNQGRRQFNRIPKALERPTPKAKVEEKKEVITEVKLPEKMTIRELADAIKMQPSVIVKKLFLEGIMVTVNHEIDFEKAQEICLEYDIIAEEEEKIDVIEELLKEDEEDESLLVSRPPVVCVMGHVDHGKTSLLDAIRDTHVTDREAGGITQHIGAYTVSIDGQKITFLDTPGHEAFTAMRMRGANSTDIAILVVAADDGVMPQTVEAINHAKAAGVEIIVAINKIDKPSANVDRVKQELSEYELIPEDWGGSTVFVPVSAHSREGIDTLLEMILLTSEVLELKANPKRKARGLVIEAQLDKGRGPVATILVQKGTLHVGDFIACGAASGKVRAMMDDKGRRIKEAGPSTPVEILGLSDVPNAGEVLVATDSDKEAKEFAATFVSENKNKLLDETKSRMSLDDLFTQIQEGNIKELPIIVKADVQGSVEAVKQSLVKLSNDEVAVKVIHGGVGAINESDVSLASASNAIIIGFNVRPDATAKATADQENIDLRLYKVIYQAIEDVEAAMKGMLDAVYEEKVIGHAEIRQIFKASGIGNIAGSYVLDGEFQRDCSVRVNRGEEQIYEGKLASLKRFKDDVKEVKAGFECGLVFEDFDDFQEEDIVEAYIMVEVPR